MGGSGSLGRCPQLRRCSSIWQASLAWQVCGDLSHQCGERASMTGPTRFRDLSQKRMGVRSSPRRRWLSGWRAPTTARTHTLPLMLRAWLPPEVSRSQTRRPWPSWKRSLRCPMSRKGLMEARAQTSHGLLAKSTLQTTSCAARSKITLVEVHRGLNTPSASPTPSTRRRRRFS